ncbi:hypothetical protein MT997_31965 [Paenibacillus sp. OVF10]|nr:hypothetical protein MT997_31965 [Paenibacillus sp. OVF10]
MAVYLLEIHENLLQTFVPVKYMDVELAYVGGEEGTDVFVGGASIHGELYRHLFHLMSNSGERAVIRSFIIWMCHPSLMN